MLVSPLYINTLSTQPQFPRCATIPLHGVSCRACCDHVRSILSVAILGPTPATQSLISCFCPSHDRQPPSLLPCLGLDFGLGLTRFWCLTGAQLCLGDAKPRDLPPARSTPRPVISYPTLVFCSGASLAGIGRPGTLCVGAAGRSAAAYCVRGGWGSRGKVHTRCPQSCSDPPSHLYRDLRCATRSP